MNDERLGKAIGEFYLETDATPPDSRESARQVATRLQRTPQLRRRRWLPSWRRGPTSQVDTSRPTEYEPMPIPATDGHTPTVIGRTQSMFSPVKAVTAAALVVGIGGVMLIAQPFDQQGAAPGAEVRAEARTPVEFTSTYVYSLQPTLGQRQALDNGVEVVTGEAWQFRNIEASDPRFAGTMTQTNTRTEYPDEAHILVGASRIETADGAWQETPWSSFQLQADVQRWRSGALPEPGSRLWRTFIGEGDYEGHWAVVEETWRPDGGTGSVDILLDGYVFEGEMPNVPEPWSAE
jgi:hypothetical protein